MSKGYSWTRCMKCLCLFIGVDRRSMERAAQAHVVNGKCLPEAELPKVLRKNAKHKGWELA